MALRRKTSSRGRYRNRDNLVPRHVAVIMDGNGRWAVEKNLPRLVGHRAGTENIRQVIEAFSMHGVEFLTLYAFSTENWGRPDEEVSGLMEILDEVIARETESLHAQGIRLLHLGATDRISEYLQRAVTDAVELTKDNQGMTISLAFNYGGRDEILRAVKNIVKDGIRMEALNEAIFGNYLYTAGIPDPDFIIRTAGELRLSNFLLWQSAYSEYYWSEVYWPDFGPGEVDTALQEYGRRFRRYGQTKS